jgi:hypothetical protein
MYVSFVDFFSIVELYNEGDHYGIKMVVYEIQGANPSIEFFFYLPISYFHPGCCEFKNGIDIYIYIYILGECPCVATEPYNNTITYVYIYYIVIVRCPCVTTTYKLFDKMFVHNDYMKANNTYIIIDFNIS